MAFLLYKQPYAVDCGPTCLRMVAKYYGRTISLEHLRNKSRYGKQGVSMLGLADAAESIGLKTVGAKLSFDQLIRDAPLPGIIHWDQYHFVVLTPQSTKNKLLIANPAKGLISLGKEDFMKRWISTNENETGKGSVLLLETTPLFNQMDFSQEDDEAGKRKIGWSFLLNYLKDHRTYFFYRLVSSPTEKDYPLK